MYQAWRFYCTVVFILMNALPEQLVLLVAIGHIRKMSQEVPECTQNLNNKKQKNFLQKIK